MQIIVIVMFINTIFKWSITYMHGIKNVIKRHANYDLYLTSEGQVYLLPGAPG